MRFHQLIITSILLLAGIICFSNSFGQISSKELRQIKKAEKYFDQGKYDEAIEKMEPIISNHKDDGRLWDFYVELHFQRYRKNQAFVEQLAFSLQELNSTTEDGKTITMEISTDDHFGLDELIDVCYESTRYIENIVRSGIYLRNFLIDQPVDTAVTQDAKDYFNVAEHLVQINDYGQAISYYDSALQIHPEYYKASLYLGDCHWLSGRPNEALEYFKKAIEKRPDLLEPRKYLTDAYIDIEKYDLALEACIEGIIAYPDSDMFRRLQTISNKLGYYYSRYWKPRNFQLNNLNLDQTAIDHEDWKYYREAKEKIAPFCNNKGLITKENELTDQNYLEAYCWEYMLSKSKSPDFNFARKAQSMGYLDCYALVSMYHISIYPQFRDLADKDPSKIKEFVRLLLMKK